MKTPKKPSGKQWECGCDICNELYRLKSDQQELVDALKLALETLRRVYVRKPGPFSSIAGTEAIAEHLIAKHQPIRPGESCELMTTENRNLH